MMSLQNGDVGEQKRKKRAIGQFKCPDCSKVFSRSDHLARHHLNHNPKQVFECDFTINEYGSSRKCGKTFVRKDLRDRHRKRHNETSGNKTNPTSEVLSNDINVISNIVSGLTPTRKPLYGSTGTFRLSTVSGPKLFDNVLSDYNGSTAPQIAVGAHSLNHIMGSQTQTTPRSNVENFPSTVVSNQNEVLKWLFSEPPYPLYHGHPTATDRLGSRVGARAAQTLPVSPLVLPPVMTNAPGAPETSVVPRMAAPSITSDVGINPTVSSAPASATTGPGTGVPAGVPAGTPTVSAIVPPSVPTTAPNMPNVPNAPAAPAAKNLPAEVRATTSLEGSGASQGWNQLSPFHYYANPHSLRVMSDLHDKNIFLSESNPLDEVFFKCSADQPFLAPSKDSDSMRSSITSTDSTSPNTMDAVSPHETTGKPVVPPYSTSFEELAIQHGDRNVPQNKAIYVDDDLVDILGKTLPTVSKEMMFQVFGSNNEHNNLKDRLSFYLWVYWTAFHRQFSILHRPSFNTKSANPCLLLCMMILGCSYSYSGEWLVVGVSPEFRFCEMIAKPLRYMIFQDDAFRPPVRLWVLQSLCLLEYIEKNYLSREMHERAHIHHGTMVQLLKRSPLLGGNPAAGPLNGLPSGEEDTEMTSSDLNSVSEDNGSDPKDARDAELFTRWVESESMKRITFMIFYLETVDYVKFRHSPHIMPHQLQLFSLPCDDEYLWGSTEVHGSFNKTVKRQTKIEKRSKRYRRDDSFNLHYGEGFLSVLKKLIRLNISVDSLSHWNVSLFVKKILFAGLLSVMYQMQQQDLQKSFLILNPNPIQTSVQWKEILARTLDNWSVVESSDFASGKSERWFQTLRSNKILTSRYSLYHLAQIIGMSDINHYDIHIFGGSPANMSVTASAKDYAIVQGKLCNMWVRGQGTANQSIAQKINLKAIVHCYLLLWETMLQKSEASTTEYLDWKPTCDVTDSMYAIGIATLVLWSYVSVTCSTESNVYNSFAADACDLSYASLKQYSAEGGYEYLSRIRNEFLSLFPRKDDHHKFIVDPNLVADTGDSYAIISRFSEFLGVLKDKQNISGLCFLVGSKLMNSQWAVMRESAKLILNCGFRSIGKTDVVCHGIFDELSV